MRFIIIHKTNAHYEAGGGPGPELIARVGANPTRYMILENVESSATPPPFAVTSRLVPYERS